MLDEFLWTEIYRPRTIEETILPADLKNNFQKFVDQKNIPNLILAGSSGMGKTTVARAMLDELGCDYIMINGSLNGNIDTLRYEIQNFASSVSLTGGRKYIILDEADFLNPNSTQPALRNFMEEFSKNCGFIFTCNLKNRIIPALHSRCSVIDFKISKEDSVKLASKFMKRVESILTKENVSYDKRALAVVIQKYYPDWRRVLNELQRYSVNGSIDSGILNNFQDVTINELFNLLKNKEFDATRKWIVDNADLDSAVIFSTIYDNCDKYITKRSIPVLVLKIAEYQYKSAFVADTTINTLAFFVECMRELEYI
jgi:DNA polymerase III delta prime subunit